MIIETKGKSTGNELLIDDWSILAVEQLRQGGCSVLLHGYGQPVTVDMSFSYMKKLFIASRERDRYTGEPRPKQKLSVFPTVVVGKHKFHLNIQTSEFKEETHTSIRIDANFPLKNDAIKTVVEYVNGVEAYCSVSFNKYDGYITIGKLFDAETVRKEVEEKIKQYLAE